MAIRPIIPVTPTLLAAALGAADVSLERSVREQESVQRGVTANTVQTVQRAGLLADDLRFNRVGDENDVAAMTTLAKELDGLVQAPDRTETMRAVEDRLASARRGGGDADLAAASQTQAVLADKLEKLVVKTKPQANAASALSEAIAQQRQVMDQTAEQADKTLGKERQELNTQEKATLEKLAREERKVDEAVKEAAKALREQAKQEQDQQQKRKLEQAAEKLEKPETTRPINEAADKLAENKLSEAQDQQQQVLDRLEQAAKELGVQSQDEMAQADKDMQRLEQMAQREQQLLDQLPQTDQPQEWNRMQAEQQDIARQLAEMQAKAPQQEAEKAAQALEKREQPQAKEAMQRTIDALKAQQQQLQNKMMAMRQKQDQQRQQKAQPQKESGKPPEKADAEDPQAQARRKSMWQVQLEPQEREVLNASRTEKFPARYEQALVRYYRALAGEQQ